MKKDKKIHISDDFIELGSKAIDSRNRLCLGKIAKLIERVRIYISPHGEILIRPIAEIPAAELWLFRNKKALKTVKKGLEEASKGKVSKLDMESLEE